MKRLSVTCGIIAVWELADNPKYVFDKMGRCFNTQKGIEIKRTYSGRSIGYYIGGKFLKLSDIREKLKKINQEEMPF